MTYLFVLQWIFFRLLVPQNSHGSFIIIIESCMCLIDWFYNDPPVGDIDNTLITQYVITLLTAYVGLRIIILSNRIQADYEFLLSDSLDGRYFIRMLVKTHKTNRYHILCELANDISDYKSYFYSAWATVATNVPVLCKTYDIYFSYVINTKLYNQQTNHFIFDQWNYRTNQRIYSYLDPDSSNVFH